MTTSSIGLEAVTGWDIDPRMRSAALEAGIHPGPARRRAVTERDLLGTDLVLTMTVDQRGKVLEVTRMEPAGAALTNCKVVRSRRTASTQGLLKSPFLTIAWRISSVVLGTAR